MILGDRRGRCDKSGLLCASELKLTGVAFPALASGVAAFPADECAEVMVGAVREYERNNPNSLLKLVHFVRYGPGDLRVFPITLERMIGSR